MGQISAHWLYNILLNNPIQIYKMQKIISKHLCIRKCCKMIIQVGNFCILCICFIQNDKLVNLGDITSLRNSAIIKSKEGKKVWIPAIICSRVDQGGSSLSRESSHVQGVLLPEFMTIGRNMGKPVNSSASSSPQTSTEFRTLQKLYWLICWSIRSSINS